MIESTMPPAETAAGNGSAREILIRVAGAVAAGIGVLGFVALVGGSDYWLRFSSAGLPADETVGDLSHGQLLVLGARDLYPFLGIAVLEVVLLYLLEQAVRGQLTIGPLARLSQLAERHPGVDWILLVRVLSVCAAIPVGVVADALIAERNTFWSLTLLAGVGVVLGLIVLLYAGGSDSSFTKFVLAALAASAVFALVSGASRTAEAPTVRPVALVIDGKPLAGIYVAVSADHVFVGEVCANGRGSEVGNASTGSLMDLPRKDVSLMLVGDNARIEEAIKGEEKLLYSLSSLTTIKRTALSTVAPPALTADRGVACTGPSAAALANPLR